MPSVYSVSRPRDWPSSTVMTPSLPTLSITSAMISPTSGSAALIDATAAICSRLSTGRDCFLSSATIASTPFSMPRLTPIGLAPALTFWRPSATIAWARTMAVVVPSPATSSVLVATSLRSWAPMFSNGSSSSISRGDGHAVVGDRRRAVLLVEDDVAALRTERHADGVGEAVDAVLEAPPGRSHRTGAAWPWCACPFRVAIASRDRVEPESRPTYGQASTIARMSFWLTMRSSSPSILNSVPAYLA